VNNNSQLMKCSTINLHSLTAFEVFCLILSCIQPVHCDI